MNRWHHVFDQVMSPIQIHDITNSNWSESSIQIGVFTYLKWMCDITYSKSAINKLIRISDFYISNNWFHLYNIKMKQYILPRIMNCRLLILIIQHINILAVCKLLFFANNFKNENFSVLSWVIICICICFIYFHLFINKFFCHVYSKFNKTRDFKVNDSFCKPY